jgi:hypothetical protein
VPRSFSLMSSTLRLKLAGLTGKIVSHCDDVQLELTSRRAAPLCQALVHPEKQGVNHEEAETGIDRTLTDKKVLST